MTDWQEVKLGDVCLFIDYRGKTPHKTTSGIPLITAKIVKNGRINEATEFISHEEYKARMTRGLPNIGDILITTEAPMGEVAELKNDKVAIGQRIITLRPQKNILNNRYLKYFLQSNIGQNQLRARESGTTVTGIKSAELKQISIYLPPLEVQKKIAGVLGALDDKIELNNKINQNLEAQAQALFKSWFVDFEPFGGKMPDDWKIGRLGEIADITMGQSPNGSSYNEDKQGCIFFQGRAEFGKRFPSVRLYTTEPKRMAKKNDILMSVRAPVGDFNIAVEDCCIGRGLCSIRAKGNFQSFVLYTIWGLQKQLEIFNGEGTVFGAINKDSLNSLPITIPSLTDIVQFEHIVSSLDNIIRNNFLENTRLAELRDTLLPKLMSGEINVDDVKID